jgi:hypothetical protein
MVEKDALKFIVVAGCKFCWMLWYDRLDIIFYRRSCALNSTKRQLQLYRREWIRRIAFTQVE